MKITLPHWTTVTVATIGVACGSFVATNAFPSLTSVFGVVAAACAALAAPNVVKS